MFRKKRSSSNPPARHGPTTTPSATSAAAVAFLNKRASDASLSASAAAAALRSHTASPEPVGAVQTKRMIRRGSTSSYGGSPSGSLRQPFSGAGIQRSASSASMTERTFRSPSPGGRRVPPPLPTLPDDVPPIPAKSHRRTSSIEAASREVSPRVSSPAAMGARTAAAGSGMATTVKWDPNTRTVVRVPVQNRIQSGNAGSPRSINFSRPMSPPVSYNSSTRELVRARPATAQGFSTADTLRGQPPMPNISQLAAIRQQSRALQTSSTSPRTPTAGPGSSAGVAPGALMAASVAARPASTAASPVSPVSPITTDARNAATRLSTVPPPAVPQSPVKTQSRSVSAPISSGSTASPSATTMTTTTTTTTTTPVLRQPARPAAAKAPSQEEIRVFQTRAAAMLARPLSELSATPISRPSAIVAGQRASVDTKPVMAPPARASTIENAPTLSATSLARASSTSPTRSAHFSQGPLLEGVKHQPPPRDLSPAKSALKSPSPRASSPAGRAMSETSETPSDEANTSYQKKRKSVRVSFDEQTVLVGEASSPVTPASSTIMSPQYKKNPLDTSSPGSDQAYTPTPALPSFGSVRGGKSPTRESEESPATLTGESQTRAKEQAPTPTIVESSSDHAVGAILSQDFATRNEGVAPESANRVDQKEVESQNVPSISVLPATPRVDEEDKPFMGDEDAEAVAQRDAEPEFVPTSHGDIAISPEAFRGPGILSREALQPSDNESEESPEVYADAAEDNSDVEGDGGFASLDAIIESPVAETAPQVLPVARSPDAPVANDSLGTAITTPESKVAEAGPTESDDWDRIRKYWSSLSEQRKQELEREAAKNAATSEFASESAAINGVEDRAAHAEIVEPPVAQSPVARAAAGQPPLPPWPDQQYQQSVKTKTPMKQTMRTPHQRAGSEPSHLRTSMRDGARAPAASVESRAPAVTSQRPKSDVIPMPASSASAAAISSVQATKAAKPKLERTLSNDSSASESSFRRQRRGSAASTEGGGYTMKRSMRGAPQPAPAQSPPTSPQSNRFSLRPTTPTGKKSTHGARASVDSTTPTLRSNGLRSKDQRASKLGFGKASRSSRLDQKSGSRFKSRFIDSSDEEEDDDYKPRRAFRSRFNDSDDDEVDVPLSPPPRLAPVRGIPRKAGQASGDSTELDDSDDGADAPNAATIKAAKANVAGPSTATPSTPPNANGTAEGKILQTGTLRSDNSPLSQPSSPPQGKTKRGFFGLGKKKQVTVSPRDGSQASNPAAATTNIISTTEPTKISQGQSTKTTTQSTPMPPKAGGPNLIRRLSSGGDSTRATATQEKAPELPPIPPIPPIPDAYRQASINERPNTSDGTSSTRMPTTLRPAIGEKRESAMTAPLAERPTIVSERTGKKKKFQGLRRFLGVQS